MILAYFAGPQNRDVHPNQGQTVPTDTRWEPPLPSSQRSVVS